PHTRSLCLSVQYRSLDQPSDPSLMDVEADRQDNFAEGRGQRQTDVTETDYPDRTGQVCFHDLPTPSSTKSRRSCLTQSPCSSQTERSCSACALATILGEVRIQPETFFRRLRSV